MEELFDSWHILFQKAFVSVHGIASQRHCSLFEPTNILQKWHHLLFGISETKHRSPHSLCQATLSVIYCAPSIHCRKNLFWALNSYVWTLNNCVQSPIRHYNCYFYNPVFFEVEPSHLQVNPNQRVLQVSRLRMQFLGLNFFDFTYFFEIQYLLNDSFDFFWHAKL